jgi:small subunit ribosomal protein S16
LAVAIRLTRVGATKRPAYRVIAIDKRRSRDGRALEILGYYDPLTDPATVQIDSDKIRAWIGKGAQPSDMVVRLLRQADDAASGSAPAKPRRAVKPKPSKKAQAKAAAAETPAEPVVEPTTSAAPAEGAAEPTADATADETAADAGAAEAPAEASDATDEASASAEDGDEAAEA